MKTLANCNPLEFLTQTNKIRKHVEKWLTLTKVMEIRRNVPEISPDMPADEKAAAWRNQVQKNISDMLTAILEEHPQETAELLCLVCFIDPKEMGKVTMTQLLGAINEILNNDEVRGFFTSLVRLGLTDGSGAAKA